MTRNRPTCGAAVGRSASGPLLAIDERRVGSCAVLTVRGEVDISSAGDLRQAVESARDARAAEIWLDLTETTFFDGRGVRTLLDLRASLGEGHRRLVVICPPGPVRRLLALTGADGELEIQSTPVVATPPDPRHPRPPGCQGQAPTRV